MITDYMVQGKYFTIDWPDVEGEVNINFDDCGGYSGSYANFYVDGLGLYAKLKEFYERPKSIE